MGFELSVVAAFFFIAAVLFGSFSYTMLSTSNELLDDASDERYDMQQSRLQTDIEVNSSTVHVTGKKYDLTVTLSNTGSETLYFDELDVLVDGSLVSYEYTGTTTLWTPAETRSLTVNDLRGDGEHRVKIVTENGVSAYDSYSV